MPEDLQWEDLPVARKSLIPGRGFFEAGQPQHASTADRLDTAEVIAVTDPDADGLTAAAIVRAHHGDATLVTTEPGELDRTLQTLADTLTSVGAVYLLDLCPDDAAILEPLETIVEAADAVIWFDHHQWDAGLREAVDAAGVDLTVGESDAVATANVAFEALGDDLGDGWADLVAVVRDHDLWLREDPRSDDLADYAHWVDADRFIEVVTEHGADLPAEARALLEERRVEKAALVEAALGRAEYRTIGEVTVGITYGRCSQNEVAEGMREAGADAAVVIKPSGGVSLRGGEGFRRCHEVAQRLGGGGHPEAAGCKPAVFDDLLDFAHHWTTHGASARHAILEAFRAVLETPGDDT